MADAASVLAKTIDATNEASDLAGVARPADQIAALQQQLAAANTANGKLQAKIDALAAAAQARKDADAAKVDGQAELDIIAAA